MTKILLAGEICAEKQYLMDEVPKTKEVSFANKINKLTSSKIINAGRILAIHNDVSIFGVIGDDIDGQQAIADLQKYNINPKLVYKTTKSSTGEVIVLTNKIGESAIILNLSAINYFDESKLNNLNEFEYVYMATSMQLSQIYKMIEKSKKNGIKIFLDFPNQQKEFNKEILKHVDFVVPNRQEAELLLNVQIDCINDGLVAVSKLKQYTDGCAIITLDIDGCVVFTNNWDKPKHFQTTKTSVIDATGSGDIFRGVFLDNYIKTNDIEISVNKALEMATISVNYSGVDESIEQIKKLI